jgi:hypothetical protein
LHSRFLTILCLKTGQFCGQKTPAKSLLRLKIYG